MEKGITLKKQSEKQLTQITATLPKDKQDYLNLNFKSKKLKDYEADDFKQLDIFLIALCKFIGISDVPELPHRKLIMSFLHENYSDFGKEEIERAINLALCFKLEVEDIKHYNKLTPQWIASILNKYKTHRGREILAYREMCEQYAESKRLKPSQADIDKSILKNIAISFKSYQADKGVIDYGNVFYSWLEEKGIIDFSNDEKQKMYEKAIDNLVRKNNKRKNVASNPHRVDALIKENESIKKEDEGIKASIKREGKRIALAKWFDWLIENKLEITNYIITFKP